MFLIAVVIAPRKRSHLTIAFASKVSRTVVDDFIHLTMPQPADNIPTGADPQNKQI
jgi:hypothetical protein